MIGRTLLLLPLILTDSVVPLLTVVNMSRSIEKEFLLQFTS